MPIRITGLNSGLDTEAIISALVSSYNYKTQKYKKAQTKLSWKQDAWKELNTKIYSLYKSVGNLRFSNAYSLKSTTVSDSTKVTVSAGSSSINGSYSIQVTSLAKSGYLTGGKLATGTTASTKLSELNVNDTTKFSGEGSFSVTVSGKTTEISVNADTTIKDVVGQLKDAGVNASYDEKNHRIYVSAKDTGEANDFSLSGSNENGTNALTALGLNVESEANTAMYQELATYAGMTKDQIQAIVTAKANATTSNTALNAANTNYQNAIDYAKAADALSKVAEGKDAEDFELLKNLASETSLSKKYVDEEGNIYKYYVATNTYTRTEKLTGGTYDEATGTYTDVDGKTYTDGTYKDGVFTANIVVEGADAEGFVDATEKYEELSKEFGLVTEEEKDGKTVTNNEGLVAFKANVKTVDSITAKASSNTTGLQELIAEADTAVASGDISAFTFGYETTIAENKETIETNNAVLADNAQITGDMTEEDIDAFMEKVAYAQGVLDGTETVSYSKGATRVDGSDATIYVNGAEYSGDSNVFSINGMTITATGVTASDYDETEASAVNVSVNTDVQGIYDKVKDFLTQYNALVNEMTKLYNAESASGYEPLSDEEKDAMSDTEIEKWEEKIKASLLRRDDTLSGLISSMTNAMSKAVKVNGKDYYLSSFGIKTLGYFNAVKNEQNAYHIDGDEDDVNTAGNADKLMAAISEDPDTVVEFLQGLTRNLYNAVDSKMKTTSLSSIYTVYNDKEMASEYSDYTSLITKWQERLEQQEEYYYQKFAAMETALSKLNSQTSAMSGFFG